MMLRQTLAKPLLLIALPLAAPLCLPARSAAAPSPASPEEDMEEDARNVVADLTRLHRSFGMWSRTADEIETLRQALEAARRGLGPAHPETLDWTRQLCAVYIEMGSYDLARQLAGGLEDLNTTSYARSLVLGGIHRRLGLTESARKLLEEAAPRDFWIRTKLARNLALAGRQAEADREFARAKEAARGQDEYVRLGYTLLEAGRHAKGENAFSTALSLEQDMADAHHHLGVYNRRLGLHRAAERHFRKALELLAGDEKRIDAQRHTLFHLALLYLAMDQPAKAEAACLESLALPSGRPPYLFWGAAVHTLGGIYLARKRVPEAISLYETALSSGTNWEGLPPAKLAALNIYLARTLRRTGKDAESRRRAREALRLMDERHEKKPDFAQTCRFAEALRLAGELAEAERVYKGVLERTLGKRPFLITRALKGYAALLEDLGRFAEAERHLLRAVKLQEDDPGRQKLLQILESLETFYEARGNARKAGEVRLRLKSIRAELAAAAARDESAPRDGP